MRFYSTLLGLLLFLFLACSYTIFDNDKSKKKEKTYLVLIETNYGDMKIKLYNETPLHRDNFLKLVDDKFYDSLIFHRIIKGFMIQGGDPESKNAAPGKMLGSGGAGYKVDAEFVPELFHKKGALCAAREGDQVNPEKKSSASQFYIVQGEKYTVEQLKQMEERINFPKLRDLVFAYVEKPENSNIKHRIDSLQRIRATGELNKTYGDIANSLEEEFQKLDLFKYTESQVEAYTTLGGTPHLDQNYTVFGEVIEGLNIIDSISAAKTNGNNRPLTDIIMHMKVLRK